MIQKYLILAAFCLVALPVSAQYSFDFPAGCPDPGADTEVYPQFYGAIQLDNVGAELGDIVGVFVDGELVGRSTVFDQQVNATTSIRAALVKVQDQVESDNLGMPCPIFAPGDDVEIRLLSGGVTYTALNAAFTGTVTSDVLDGFDGDVAILDVYNFLTSLPVSLVDFKANLVDDQVHLNWATSQETDNSHFEIERSSNGENGFVNIGKVEGNSTTEAFNSYDFTDANPAGGMNYYRLRQVDFDGDFTYSPVVAIETEFSGDRELSVFPNPAASNGRLTINLKGDWAKGATEMRLVDATGRLVSEWKDINPGSVNTQLPELAAGMYQLIASDSKDRRSVRVIVR